MILEEEYDYLLIETKNEKIAKALRTLWGCEDIYEYLDKLFVSSAVRLDSNMFESLLRLEQNHEIIFPKLVNKFRNLKRIDRTI